MTGAEFRAWRARCGLTNPAAARALGLVVRPDGTCCDAIRHYERGSRGVPEPVARLCRYIERYGPIEG